MTYIETLAAEHAALLEDNQAIREELALFLDMHKKRLYTVDAEGQSHFSSLTVRLLLHACINSFRDDHAVNCVEMKLFPDAQAVADDPTLFDWGPVVLTIQRDQGKTPVTLMQKAQAERDQALARVAELEALLELEARAAKKAETP